MANLNQWQAAGRPEEKSSFVSPADNGRLMADTVVSVHAAAERDLAPTASLPAPPSLRPLSHSRV